MHEFKVGDRVMSDKWKLGPGTITEGRDRKGIIFGDQFEVTLDDGQQGLFRADELELIAQ